MQARGRKERDFGLILSGSGFAGGKDLMAALEDYLHPLKSIYRSSPASVKHSIGKAYSLFPDRIKYGSAFSKNRSDLQESQYASAEKLQGLQLESLRKVIAHCWQNVPFYSRYWTQHGLSEARIEQLSDIQAYPMIDKQTIRDNIDQMVAKGYASHCLPFNTGGSTGEPLKFFWEKSRTRILERAFIERQWRWAGYELGDKTAIVKGQTVKTGKHFDPTQNALYISGFKLTDSDIASAIAAMREFKPLSLQAYPSTASVIANYMLRNNVDPIDSLKVVLCGSENLYPAQRQVIENAFGCRVYSWYGHGESVCLAGGCEESNHYHAYSEYGLTELIDDSGNVVSWEQGNRGEIVGTGFNNYAMPLVRYKTADIGVAGPASCTCGRAYPLLQSIEGRKQEYVVGPDNNLVALTALIFGQHHAAFEHIDKMQIEQHVAGEFLVRIVPTGNWPSTIKSQLKQSILAVSPSASRWQVSVDIVDNIPSTAMGKHRFVIQHMDVNQGFTV